MQLHSMKGVFSRRTTLLMLWVVLFGMMSLWASAQPITVNTLADEDDGNLLGGSISLREAVSYSSAGDEVLFSVTGTITLGGTQIAVPHQLTISGPGPRSLAVDGDGASRIFDVASGTTVTIAGLTLKGGSATGNGGAIRASNGAFVTLTSCTLNSNEATGSGGALSGSDADLSVSQCNFTSNTTEVNGGAISSVCGTGLANLTVDNSTFSRNRAEDTGFNTNYGGAVYNYDTGFGTGASATVTNCTFYNNTAQDNGGGIYNTNPATCAVNNSLILSNAAGALGPDYFGVVTSNGHNLLTSTFNSNGFQNTTETLVGAVSSVISTFQSDNGGPTDTFALVLGGPAIDSGDNAATSGTYSQDQRGFERLINGTVDMGAIEVQPPQVDSVTLRDYDDLNSPDPEYTNAPTVWAILGNVTGGVATRVYMSQQSDFSTSSSLAYDANSTPTYTLVGTGMQTLYLKLYGPEGFSEVVTDTIMVDMTNPTADDFISTPTSWVGPGDDLLFGFSVSEALNTSPTVTVNGNPTNLQSGTYPDYVTSYTVPGSDPDGDAAIYIQAIDLAGNSANIPAFGVVTIDGTSPFGSVLINGGDSYTSTTSVELTLSAADTGSGVADMRFSNDGGGTWPEGWIPYTTLTTWTLAAGADGARTVTAEFRDNVGNISNQAQDNIVLDSQVCSGTVVINDNDSYANSLDVTLTLQATAGASGVDLMRISNDGTDYSAWMPFGLTKAWTLEPAGNGGKVVWAQFHNQAGYISAPTSDTITVDLNSPTGGISINNGATSSTTSVVDLYLTAADVGSTVTHVRFSNDNSTWFSWEAYTTDIRTNWALLPGDGSREVYVQYRDAADNVSSGTLVDDITVDSSIPTGSIIINDNDLFTSNALVNLTLNAVDTGLGVKDMAFSNNGVAWSSWVPYDTASTWTLAAGADGQRFVYARFRDQLNQVSATENDDIWLDTTAPTGFLTIDSGQSYTTDTLVDLACSATDFGAGVDQMRFSNDQTVWSDYQAYANGTTWTLAAVDGESTVWVEYTDAAGNSVVTSDTITLDTTAPTGTIAINNGNYYTNTPSVTLNLSATDGTGLGVTGMRFRNESGTFGAFVSYSHSASWNLSSGDATKTVFVEFSDLGGNISEAVFDVIKLDTADPVSSFTLNDGAEATSVTTVYPAMMANDNQGPIVSGLAANRFSNDASDWGGWNNYDDVTTWGLTAGEGTKTVYSEVRDVAGNTSAWTSRTIILDQTAPESMMDAPLTDPTQATQILSWTAQDDGVTTAGLDYIEIYLGQEKPEQLFLSDQPVDDTVTTELLKTVDGAVTTTTFFSGSYGGNGTYFFYTVAVDKAGNREAVPGSFDQTLTVSTTNTLTVSAGTGSGDVEVNGQAVGLPTTWTSPEFVADAEVEVEAIPAVGYLFSDWSGAVPAGRETDNPCTFTMNGGREISPNFVDAPKQTLMVLSGANEGGNVVVDGTTHTLTEATPYTDANLLLNQEVTLYADPAEGFGFSLWSGDVPAGHETDNPLTLAMNASKTVTPNFSRSRGIVSVVVSPETATWQFMDSEGTAYNGTGNSVVPNVPTGDVALTWGDVTGYNTPNPATSTKTLTAGSTVNFQATYAILPPLADIDPVTPEDSQSVSAATLNMLDWTDATRAQIYDVYLWKTGDGKPEDPTVEALSSSAYSLPNPLSNQEAYSWQVVVRNNSGSAVGPVWYFNTYSGNAATILEYLLGKRNLNAAEMAAADQNSDGQVDIADLITQIGSGRETAPMIAALMGQRDPMPDLSIESIYWWPYEFSNLEDTIVGFNVRNLGDAASTSCTWSIKVDDVSVAQGTLDGVPASEVVSVQNLNLGQLSIGVHDLEVTVDWAWDVEESNEDNNVKYATINIYDGTKPDLTVLDLRRTGGVVPWNDLEAPTLTFRAENDGDKVSTPTLYQVHVNGGLDVTGDFPVLYPDRRYDIQGLRLGLLTPGTHSVKVTLDPYNQMEEWNDANNSLTENFTVVMAPRGLTVGSVRANRMARSVAVPVMISAPRNVAGVNFRVVTDPAVFSVDGVVGPLDRTPVYDVYSHSPSAEVTNVVLFADPPTAFADSNRYLVWVNLDLIPATAPASSDVQITVGAVSDLNGDSCETVTLTNGQVTFTTEVDSWQMY